MTQSPTVGKTIYPEPYASFVKGRLKRKLGEYFGLTNFGVNLIYFSPGAISALAHSHFYILAFWRSQSKNLLKMQGKATL